MTGVRVCMLVANDIWRDSRVQKIAWSAADAGYDALLIGKSTTRATTHTSLGAARLLRVPPAGPTGDALRRIVAQPPAPLAALAHKVDRVGSGLRRRALASARPPEDPTAAIWRRGVWRTLIRDGGWRRTQPQLRELNRAYRDQIEAFAPDLIHAHEVFTLGIAVRAKERAARAGRQVSVVYDAHELVAGVRSPIPQWRSGFLSHEQEYIGRADAVVTVSELIARRLQAAYDLPVLPTVVTNAPFLRPPVGGAGDAPALRAVVGLADDVPLLVYSGAVAPQRGLPTVVQALRALPGVHLAVVCATPEAPPPEVVAAARESGVTDRVHFAGYVAPNLVPAFLASATVGMIPILHYPNHELALITKYYEYMHARLPIVVSDVEAMAEHTRQLGNGEVFVAGDPASCAEAVRRALDNRERYVAAYTDALLERESWEGQTGTLLGVYERLTGRTPEGRGASEPFVERSAAQPEHRPQAAIL